MRHANSIMKPLILIILCIAQLSHAAAGVFVSDERLEAKLRKSDPATLAIFPAAGFRDGVAGFVKRYGLYVVPHSEQAWCQDGQRGRLQPGCYVVVFLQLKGSKPKMQDVGFCGSPARWYKAPGSRSYIPIPEWLGIAKKIADDGDSAFVLSFMKEDDRRLRN
jgi:hypothetical protein